MMKKLLFFSAFMAFSFIATAQNIGDYQSVGGVGLAWQDISTWLEWDGDSWEPATDYPANGVDISYSVTIVSGSDVQNPLTVDLVIASGGELIVQTGGTLTVSSANSSQLVINTGGSAIVDGTLNCEQNIDNSGALTVNGTLINVAS
jgi:hypothetical protein